MLTYSQHFEFTGRSFPTSQESVVMILYTVIIHPMILFTTLISHPMILFTAAILPNKISGN